MTNHSRRPSIRTLVASGALALAWALALPTTAAAQVSGRFLGGFTHAAEREPFLGAALGLRAGVIEIDGEVGRMFNILPDGLLERLNELQIEQGLPVQAIAKLPATYYMGNLRVFVPLGPVRPFVAVGAGVARLEPRFEVSVAGISLGDVFGLADAAPRTESLFAAGGGVRIHVGDHGLVEAGYRYLFVFTDFSLASGFRVGRPDVNNIYGAIGFRF
ncbi:MAG TPA: hypothetical protein VMM93_00365 [Vicinamibacterales bacterium]|nr:hypothetical protein [Vicinamibacterales bacterium]